MVAVAGAAVRRGEGNLRICTAICNSTDRHELREGCHRAIQCPKRDAWAVRKYAYLFADRLRRAF
jgi:hypothetical protein